MPDVRHENEGSGVTLVNNIPGSKYPPVEDGPLGWLLDDVLEGGLFSWGSQLVVFMKIGRHRVMDLEDNRVPCVTMGKNTAEITFMEKSKKVVVYRTKVDLSYLQPPVPPVPPEGERESGSDD